MSKYKVGDKFVVEISEKYTNDADDFVIENEILYRVKGFKSLVFDNNGLDKLQKVEGLQRVEDNCIPYNIAYEQGLQDAWELARKICGFGKDNFDGSTLGKIFDENSTGYIVTKNTYQEALAKIEAYEKSQQIQVGNVVVSKKDNRQKFVVTYIFQERNKVAGTRHDGVQIEYDIDDVIKTGQHIDIEHLLEQIRGDE